MLSRRSVEDAIAEIRTEVHDFEVPQTYFEKFGDAPYDREVRGYFAGDGGVYLKFMPLLLRKLHLSNLLELGNYAGASTVSLYAGMATDAKLTTIDIIRDQRYCTDAMRDDPRVAFVIGDVLDLSIYGPHVPMDIDFLFEDTHHFYFHIRDIFDIYQHLLADRALFAIDDINDNDKRRFFNEVPYPKWDLTELCHSGGWGLILFEREEPRSTDERLLAAHRAAMRIWKRRHDEQVAVVEENQDRKLRNRLQTFLHGHKRLHTFILDTKRFFHLIPRGGGGFDEKRFYSAGRVEEERRVRRHIRDMKK